MRICSDPAYIPSRDSLRWVELLGLQRSARAARTPRQGRIFLPRGGPVNESDKHGFVPSHLPVFLCFACIGTPSHLLVFCVSYAEPQCILHTAYCKHTCWAPALYHPAKSALWSFRASPSRRPRPRPMRDARCMLHGGLAPAPAGFWVCGCCGCCCCCCVLCSVYLTPSHLPVFECFACFGTPSHLLMFCVSSDFQVHLTAKKCGPALVTGNEKHSNDGGSVAPGSSPTSTTCYLFLFSRTIVGTNFSSGP
jgi:hypothetical protein